MHASLLHHALKLTSSEPLLPRLQLIRNCSAALAPKLAADLSVTFDCEVLPTYAMSECVPVTSPPRGHQASKDLSRYQHVGVSCGVDLGILDLEKMTVSFEPGLKGEVVLKGAFLNKYKEAQGRSDFLLVGWCH